MMSFKKIMCQSKTCINTAQVSILTDFQTTLQYTTLLVHPTRQCSASRSSTKWAQPKSSSTQLCSTANLNLTACSVLSSAKMTRKSRPKSKRSRWSSSKVHSTSPTPIASWTALHKKLKSVRLTTLVLSSILTKRQSTFGISNSKLGGLVCTDILNFQLKTFSTHLAALWINCL